MNHSPSSRLGAALLASALLSGCSSIRIDTTPVSAVPATSASSATPAASRKVIVIPTTSYCLAQIDPNLKQRLQSGLVQQAETALSNAGYTVVKGIAPDQTPPDTYSLFLNTRCNGYESRGAWLGILSLSILPAWGYQAITVDITTADPQRKVIGQHTQAHKLVWAYSGYTPLGLLLGNGSSPEYLGKALDLNPALVHSLMTP